VWVLNIYRCFIAVLFLFLSDKDIHPVHPSLAFVHLVHKEESDLVFRPLSPKQETKLYLICNKYQTFTPIAERFLVQARESF
jgi:hypothetical protein